MVLKGSQQLPGSPDQIYRSLTDPEKLRRAIPGCESMEKTGDDEYRARLRIGLAAIKGNYSGKIRLSDQQPPHRFTLHIDGKGGAGFVTGSAQISLRADGDQTLLEYNASLQVGGLIAAVGSRVIDAAAHKLANEFFRSFAESAAS